MKNHFYDLSLITLIFIAVSISFAGWGRLTLHMAKAQNSGTNPYLNIWIGLIASVFTAEFVQIFIPINWIFSLLFIFAGFILFFYKIKINYIQKITNFNFDKVLLIGSFLFITIVSVSIGMIPSGHYDVTLYYEPTISWLNNYSISFGLANLHTRLAYNQSIFLFSALLDFYPFWNHGLSVANIYLTILTILSVWKLCILIPKTGIIFLFILAIVFVENIYVSISPSPDASIGTLQILIFTIVLYIYYLDFEKQIEKNELLILLLFLFCLSISIKLSSGFFILFCALLVSPKYIIFLKENTSVLIRVTFICILFLTIHLIRGYILSGFPLLPSTFGGLVTATWALSIESVRNESIWVYGWSRLPGKDPAQVLENWDWLPFWFSAFPLKGKIIFAFSIFFIILSIFSLPKKGNNLFNYPNITWLFFPLLFSVFFWFLIAPDFRFLGTIPELLLSLSILIFYMRLINTKLWFIHKKILIISVTIILLFIIIDFFLNFRVVQNFISIYIVEYFFPNVLPHEIAWKVESIYWRVVSMAIIFLLFIFSIFVKKPVFSVPIVHRLVCVVLVTATLNLMTLVMGFFVSEQKGWRTNPQPTYHQKVTNSGLVINVPNTGDQCGYIPFPCSPYVSKNLHIIDNFFDFGKFGLGFNNLGIK